MGGGQGGSDQNGAHGGPSGAGPRRGYNDGQEIDSKAEDPSVAQQDIERSEPMPQNKKASQNGPESSVNNTDRKDEMKNEGSE